MADRPEASEKGRRIVMLRASWETQEKLREWAISLGFDLAWSYSGWPQATHAFDFHVTLLATANDVTIPEGARMVEPVTATPEGFAEMGKDRRVPTLALKADDTLTAMRDFFVKTFGAKPTFAEFKPHLSLSYKWDGEPVIETLPFPDFPIVLDMLIVSEFDDAPKIATDAKPAERRVASMTDKGTIGGSRFTHDGYMVTECKVARTGIQEYYGHEIGDVGHLNRLYRIWRPEGEVFKADSLASFAHKPVTLGHPEESVTADTWKRDAVGNVGGEIQRDGGFVRVPLILMDQGAIDLVKAGTREISMGYDCRLDMTPGTTPDGQAYDAIQRDIRINHCAIVEAGRAGPACRIGDRVQRDSNPQEDTHHMTKKTVTVDGRSFEVTADIAAVIEAQTAKIGALSDTLNAASAVLPKSIETIDSLKALVSQKDKALADAVTALDAAKKAIPTAADLAKMAKDRADLIDTAKKIAADVEIGDEDAAGIRAKVVAHKMGDAAVKDRSTDYVAAMFDALSASANTEAADPIRDALKSGAAPSKTTAYDSYKKSLEAAWNQ